MKVMTRASRRLRLRPKRTDTALSGKADDALSGVILLSGFRGSLRATARLHKGCGLERHERLRRVFAVLQRMNIR